METRLHEQVREYNSPRFLFVLCLRVSPTSSTEDFSSLSDESYTRIYDAVEAICYSASIAHKRYSVLNPKYVCSSDDNAGITCSTLRKKSFKYLHIVCDALQM